MTLQIINEYHTVRFQTIIEVVEIISDARSNLFDLAAKIQISRII